MRKLVLWGLLSLSLLTVSCGGRERVHRLAVSGSSTLAPLMEVMLDDYVESGFEGTVSLDAIGSGAGIRRYLRDECDIVSASRPMTAEEESEARALGKVTEHVVVAMDAVAVCTGGEISGNVSLEELPALLTADSWRDIRLEWPTEPIEKYYPGRDSGTFDFIVSTLFDGDSGPLMASSGLQLSEDDHILVQGLLGDPWSLGFFGYSYYVDGKDALTMLSIGGSKPEDGDDYPLSRPLFLYFDAADETTLEVTRDFAGFVLEAVAGGDLPKGFLPPPDRLVEEGLRTLANSGGSADTP